MCLTVLKNMPVQVNGWYYMIEHNKQQPLIVLRNFVSMAVKIHIILRSSAYSIFNFVISTKYYHLNGSFSKHSSWFMNVRLICVPFVFILLRLSILYVFYKIMDLKTYLVSPEVVLVIHCETHFCFREKLNNLRK